MTGNESREKGMTSNAPITRGQHYKPVGHHMNLNVANDEKCVFYNFTPLLLKIPVFKARLNCNLACIHRHMDVSLVAGFSSTF